MGGEIQDTSKKSVLKAIEQADLLQEVRGHPPPGDQSPLWTPMALETPPWGPGTPHIPASTLIYPPPDRVKDLPRSPVDP